MGDTMADIKDIIANIENVYGSNNSLNLLKDFERVIDELDTYVYDNWIEGELVQGPIESRYWVQCARSTVVVICTLCVFKTQCEHYHYEYFV